MVAEQVVSLILGKTRRILAWALGSAIVLVGIILFLSVLEVLPDVAEEVVAVSGSVSNVLAQAWFANPRRSVLVLAFCLGAEGFAFFIIGIEAQYWPCAPGT